MKLERYMKLLGIDFGTTSVKAQLFNESLEVLDSCLLDYTLKTSGSLVELEAEKYLSLLDTVIEKMRNSDTHGGKRYSRKGCDSMA